MGHELAYAAAPGVTSVMDAIRHMKAEHTEHNGSYHSVDAAWQERDVTILPGKVTQKMAYAAVDDGYYKARETSGIFCSPTVAVRLYDESTLTRRTVNIKVRFTGDQCDQYGPTQEFLEAQVKDALGTKLRAGEFMESWATARTDDGRPDITLTTKVVATAPKEKAVTKYFIHAKGENPLNQRGAWERGFDSQSAARAAAVNLLESGSDLRFTPGKELEITAVTRRESGTPVVSVKRVISKGVTTVAITLVKSSDPNKNGGWAVGADCHH